MFWIGLVPLLALPFVCTKWLLAIRRMNDPADSTSGPMPWCILMAVLLGVIWLALNYRLY